MSRNFVDEDQAGRNPMLRGRAAALSLPFAALLAIGAIVHADPVDEVPARPVALDDTGATDDRRDRIDEIVVYGNRKRDDSDSTPSLPIDPLRARVLNEIRELELLEGEYDWRTEKASLDVRPPRIRFGYDARNDTRTPVRSLQQTLPLEFVQPATVFSIDF